MTDQTRYYRTPGGTIHVHMARCDAEPACSPVVMLDPTDDADVERLAEAMERDGVGGNTCALARSILANLLPPEPVTEPGGGAWAVVKDRDGDVWVRHENGEWGFGGSGGCYDWSSLVALYGPITVVREGIES